MPAVDKAPRFSCQEAAQIAAGLYDLDAVAESLPSERDQNFRLRDASGAQFVLKIANKEETREVLDLQNRLFRHLADHPTGMEFPRIIPVRSGDEIGTLAAEDGTPYWIRLLTWVDGVCFAQVRPHSVDLLRSLGAMLARMDNATESFSHPAARRVMQWDLRQAVLPRAHVPLLPEALRRLVEPVFEDWAALDWSALRHSVIYNDANDYNILVDPEGRRVLSLLDFGDVVYTATICDLAIALAYAMLDKPDPIASAAEIVAAYHRERTLSTAEVEALYTLTATRLCASVCHAAYQMRQAPANEYLNISNDEATALLERLASFPAGWATEVFRRACGYSKEARPADSLLQSRRALLGPNLSLSYGRPLHIIRGWRQHLYDSSGRRYLDCVNNVAHVGHCHPRVTEAIARQSAQLNTNTRYLHEHLIEYSERLTATLPDPLSVVFLVCSGSEANELALRLARAHTGSGQVMVVDVAYHGNTNALVDISPYKFNGPGGRGKPAHVHVMPMPDVYRGPHRGADAGARFAEPVAETARATGPAAFICESALGCGGQIILPDDYMKSAFTAVRAAGGVSIADEVQTGFGRAGSHFWMFETQGVVPDIVTMGKPIGNGHPMGAVVTTPEIAASFANGMEYFNTFGGNPVSCAVGLAVLDIIRDEGLQENARAAGDYLLDGLRDLAQHHPIIGDVRGLGLFVGIELVRNRETREPAPEEASALVDRMKDRGVLLSTDGPFHNVIKIKPPIVFSRTDADTVLGQLQAAL